MRVWLVSCLLLSALVLPACNGRSSKDVDADTDTDTDADTDADTEVPPDLAWTAGDTLTDAELCVADFNIVKTEVCCATRAPMPTAVATVLDLRGLPDSDAGLCRIPTYVDGAQVGAIELPADPAQYPLKVLLPARQVPHPACVGTCTSPIREGTTALAVVFHIRFGLENDYAPTLVVSAPWQVISAGDGDPSSDACLDGYQEFGMRSCIRFPYVSTFGVATATPPEAGGELLIEVAPKNGDFTTNCCPYLPRTP